MMSKERLRHYKQESDRDFAEKIQHEVERRWIEKAWKLKMEREAHGDQFIEESLREAGDRENTLRWCSIGCKLLAVIVCILVLLGIETEFRGGCSKLGVLLNLLMATDLVLIYNKVKIHTSAEAFYYAALMTLAYPSHNPETPEGDKDDFIRWYYQTQHPYENSWCKNAYLSAVLASCANIGDGAFWRCLSLHPLFRPAAIACSIYLGLSIACLFEWRFSVSFFHIFMLVFFVGALISFFHDSLKSFARHYSGN